MLHKGRGMWALSQNLTLTQTTHLITQTFPISSVHATVCWAGISRPSTHLLNKLLQMKITADELAQLLVIFNLA